MTITIIDYGMGNLQSVYNAVRAVGEEALVSSNPKDLVKADAIILPGVGSFYDGITNLKKFGFIEALNEEVIDKKKPYLGICLGMQFLGEKGFEHGINKGFGWVKGNTELMEPQQNYKIPHIGWNSINFLKDSILVLGLENNTSFYFVHSFQLIPKEDVLTSTAQHGMTVNASVEKGNIFATQFHPEKSQGAGLTMLKNFVNFVNNK